MTFFKRFSAAALFLSFLVMLVIVNSADAQQLDCSANVKKALQTTNDKCSSMTRNKACYGSGLINAEPADGVTNFNFQTPGDTVDVTQVKSMRLAPLDPKGAQWGVAYLRIQANLPDTTAGQYVTMLMFGDALFDDQTQPASTGAPAKSINAVYFGTGVGSPACHNAPTSGMVIQAPKGAQTVNLTVDGVKLGVNSTVFIQATIPDLDITDPIQGAKISTVTPTATPLKKPTKPPTPKPNKPKLIITTIQGHVSVTTNGHTKIITNNQSATVTLNETGDLPVDDPVVEQPSENMQALIDLTTPNGSEGLYLTEPDLSATEPPPETPTDNVEPPSEMPGTGTSTDVNPNSETATPANIDAATLDPNGITAGGIAVGNDLQSPPPTEMPPQQPPQGPPQSDPGGNAPPSDPGSG